jgi:predicted nucleic acid-binding protein
MWLEYFADTENGDLVADVIENTDELIVPTITIYEVFKKLLLERNEKEALFFISHMRQGNVIHLNDELSLYAAKLGKEYKLPMADSIIYATNIKYNCVLWTQDKHFLQ